MGRSKQVGVLIVDDHEIARQGIRSRLEEHEEFSVIGELPTADDLLTACDRERPDIVLMDVDMPGADPFSAIIDLRRAHPDIRVVMLSAYHRDRYVESAAQAGSWGYLTKDEGFDQIVEGIRRVARGEYAFTDAMMSRFELVDGHLQLRQGVGGSPIDELTPRELEVMRLIARGLSTKEIAHTLHRSPKTIDAHRTSLMRKLNIDDRVELTRYAIREGIVEP